MVAAGCSTQERVNQSYYLRASHEQYILRFLTLYGRMILNPAKTFNTLFEHRRKVTFGLLAMLVPALGYTLFYLIA